MSLWHCPEHGLYGGDIYCPQCGKNGDYVTLEAPKPKPCIHLYYCSVKAVSRQRGSRKRPSFPICSTCPFIAVIARWNLRDEEKRSRNIDVILSQPDDSKLDS